MTEDKLLRKFEVNLLDHRDIPPGDRTDAFYIVLDVRYDSLSRPAALLYAQALEDAGKPGVAHDIRALIARLEKQA